MSPTSYRAAPPRVSEDRNYSKAFQLRQTLSAFIIYPAILVRQKYMQHRVQFANMFANE